MKDRSGATEIRRCDTTNGECRSATRPCRTVTHPVSQRDTPVSRLRPTASRRDNSASRCDGDRFAMRPTAFALKGLTAAEETRIDALVKKAVAEGVRRGGAACRTWLRPPRTRNEHGGAPFFPIPADLREKLLASCPHL